MRGNIYRDFFSFIGKLTTPILVVGMVFSASLLSAKAREDVAENSAPISKKYNKSDRTSERTKFVYKGELMGGASISHTSIDSKNSSALFLIDNLDASGNITSVTPYIGYFYRDNNCFGIRFGYNHIRAEVNGGLLDFGPSNDLSFDVPTLSVMNDSYSYSAFHRSYIAIDNKGRFGLFAELEGRYTHATMTTQFDSKNGGNLVKGVYNNYELDFNPGMAVFIFPNVCTTFSFGMGGLKYNQIQQYNEAGERIGERQTSKLSFAFNAFAIKLGIVFHIWSNEEM